MLICIYIIYEDIIYNKLHEKYGKTLHIKTNYYFINECGDVLASNEKRYVLHAYQI